MNGTNTVFNKSFFKKVVPITSNRWLYHADLLVFCLKFTLAPVCEYLQWYYSITNEYWTIP